MTGVLTDPLRPVAGEESRRPRAWRSLGGTVGELLPAGLQLIVCALAVVIASIAFGPFFVDSSFLLPIAGATVLGTLCGLAVIRWRRPPGLAWALSLVAFVLYAAYLLFPESTSSGFPGPAALAAVGDGLLNGLARMLTVTPPADVQGDLLILPVALAFAAAIASTVLCAGSSVLLPVLPPMLLFVCALLLSANTQEFRWRTTLAFLGCLLVVVLLRANPRGDQKGQTAAPGSAADSSRSSWRPNTGLLLGLPVVVGVAMLAVTAAAELPVVDGSTRFDPRAVRQVPLTIQDQLNPLVAVREQLLLPAPIDLFTIRAADGEPIPFDRLRTAALDEYDGVQWLASARFLRTGSTLPAGAQLTDSARFTADVTLSGAMPSPFLPEFGRPVSIEASQVGFDSTSGLLATSAPTLDGYRYRLTGEYVASTPDPATAVPDPQPGGESMIELPELPGDPAAALKTLAQQWTSGITTPYAQLASIADRMRHLSYAPDATPGQSFAALDRFVDTTDPAVGKTVTEEQTAAAFAVMARALGYPARVAVGYRLDPQRAVDGTITVTTGDADAWAEVAFQGRGWEPFQVTPPRQGDPPPPPATPQGIDQGSIIPTPPGQPGPSGTTGASVADKTVSWGIALAVLLPLLLLIAATAAVALAKQWRRNRRSTVGSTSDRIIGAWRETTDRLGENGMSVTTVRTPSEIGEHTAEKFGKEAGHQVTTLAPILSQAIYAPGEPDEAAVVKAWDLESELHAILDSRRPWWAAALFWVDPRPLWRGPRRSRPTSRTGSNP